MTAVIYARYSSDNQREESIEGQIRECTAYAEKNGIHHRQAQSQVKKIVQHPQTAYLRYAVCGCCLCIKNANCYKKLNCYKLTTNGAKVL